MADKINILIVSTSFDYSLRLFRKADTETVLNTYVINYDSTELEFATMLKVEFDIVYFRDPFNDISLTKDGSVKTIELIAERYKNAYFVDGVNSYDDLLFEDKWLQYNKFSKFMPDTKLLDSNQNVDFTKFIVKKRISSRSRDIIFSSSKLLEVTEHSDYIIQQKLDITKEYRVYIVGGKIISPMVIKTSKTTTQDVKVIAPLEIIPSEITKICEEAYESSRFDFIGLDIALVESNYYLLEVNRSCQFTGFDRETSVNLANSLNEHLLSVLETG